MLPVRLALAGSLSLLALAACSGGDGTSSGATPDQTTTSATMETTSTEATSSTAESSGAGVSGTGYSIAIPDGWEDVLAAAQRTNSAADVAVAEPQQPGEFRTNFNTVTPNPIDDSVTDQQLAAQAARELKSVTHTAVTPVDAPDFDGTPALGQTSETAASGFTVTLIQYIVRHQGQVYATTMTFDSTKADDAKAALDDIVASWTWDNS